MTVNLWTSAAEPFVSQDEERAIIRASRSSDEAARERLIRAYLPALRNALRRLNLTAVRHGAKVEDDDARQAAVLGLFEAAAAFDPDRHPTLAGIAPRYITGALSALTDTVFGYAVPERTRERYAQVMRAADGDPELAAELAPAHNLAAETFREIHLSYAVTGAYDGERDVFGGDAADWRNHTAAFGAVEDSILSAAALAVLDAGEREIVSLAYGFASGEPLSVRDIAARIGTSKSSVSRALSSSLAKMRASLGAAS